MHKSKLSQNLNFSNDHLACFWAVKSNVFDGEDSLAKPMLSLDYQPKTAFSKVFLQNIEVLSYMVPRLDSTHQAIMKLKILFTLF